MKHLIWILTFSILYIEGLKAQTYHSEKQGKELLFTKIEELVNTLSSNNFKKFESLNTGDFILLTYGSEIKYRDKEIIDQPARSAQEFQFGLKSLRFSSSDEKFFELKLYLADKTNWRSKYRFRVASKTEALKIKNEDNFVQRRVRHNVEIIAKRSFEDSFNVKGWIIVDDLAKRNNDRSLSRSFQIKNIIFFH